MRRLLVIMILCIAGTLYSAEKVLVDGVAARVNDEVVTVGEVMRLMAPMQQNLLRQYRGDALKAKLKELFENTLNTLIERRLIIASYEDQDMKIPDWVVQERIDDVVRDNFKGDRSELMSVLAREKVSYSDWEQQWRERIIVASMRSSFVGQNVKVSPNEVRARYDSQKDQFQTPDKVRLRMIYLKAKDDQAEGAARKKAEDLLGRIKSGEPFADIASEFSEGRHAEDGGDWGWVEPDVLRGEIANTIKDLGPGQLSGIVEAGKGCYILKVEEKQPGSVSSFEDVRAKIETELRDERGKEIYDAWIKRLQTEAYVEVVDLELFDNK